MPTRSCRIDFFLRYQFVFHVVLHGRFVALMNPYTKFKFEIMRKARSCPDYMPIRVHELAAQYEMEA